MAKPVARVVYPYLKRFEVIEFLRTHKVKHGPITSWGAACAVDIYKEKEITRFWMTFPEADIKVIRNNT